jgi:plastocyanin
MKKLIFFIALTAFAALSQSVFAANVTGQTVLDGKGSSLGDAVVYLEGGQASTPLRHAVIDQRDKMFMPHVTVITQGTTVDFPNDDTVFHNVFAFYQAKKFDLGMYPQGASKKVTFDKTGLVVLLCNVHSDMSAFIMVVDTPYYAISDKRGNFQISDLPPGHYTLHAWHESGVATTEPIDITDSDAPLAVSLKRG